MSIDDAEKAIKQRIQQLNTEIQQYVGKLRPYGIVENRTHKIMGLEEALNIIDKLKRGE